MGGASGHDDLTAQLTSKVIVACLDALLHDLMDAWVLEADQRRSEHDLWRLRLVVLRQRDLGAVWHDVVIGVLRVIHGDPHVGVQLALGNAETSHLVLRQLVLSTNSSKFIVVKLLIV